MAQKRVGLALGGGAVRGMAHVGVIRTLEREGIPVSCIAGTSVGALVGAVYAAGLRGEQLLDLALKIGWRHLARPAWSRYGLVSFARLEAFFVETLGDLTFADLKIPYAAVAADLQTSEPVILREGRVARAVRASATVPGVVTPAEWNGRRLVDGGVVNNLPISMARSLGADVVIAVGLAVPQAFRPRSIKDMLLWAVETLLIRAGDDPATADVYIPVPLGGLRSLLRFSSTPHALRMGEAAAERALPAIRAALAPE